ncbi:MAG: macro domain-containing protein [Candidatus Neoclostridium sp.]
MPLKIKRLDILKTNCDIIVNATDERYSGGGGMDSAVHRAAGSGMDKACAALKPLGVGEAAATDGFGLSCSHVIHVAGPKWRGGGENEAALLRGCYINALLLASSLGAKSIAFPLISSGTNGFPKERVLRIATQAISDYLCANTAEMDVELCVFDQSAYELSYKTELESFLSDNGENTRRGYVLFSELPFGNNEDFSFIDECRSDEDFDFSFSEEHRLDDDFYFPYDGDEERRARAENAESAEITEERAQLFAAKQSARAGATELEAWIKNHDDTFAVTLLKLIDEKKMTDAQCYKKANVSRKTFYKINNDPKYRPSKQTVIAFAIALELTLEETERLLRTVGFSLSHSNKFDLIVEFFITNGIYDVFEINAALYKYDQVCLGC